MTETRVYAAFGDSITDGYGVARSFVFHAADRIRGATPHLEWTILVRGMSGETSTEALYRLDRDLLSQDPDLVTVNFGVNDAFSGISPERFADNLKTMVHRVKENGCGRIVLLSSEVIPEPEAERQVLPYWDAMRRTADDTGSVYADVNGYWQKLIDAGRNQWDMIIPGDLHPNEEGHRVIGEAVWLAIEESRLLEDL
ncbi:MAG: SGNH/GDSL hydrolase family protein [bacterium]|nr:MAG: SGNH/GDSL hydrolase family protein [bacterium]